MVHEEKNKALKEINIKNNELNNNVKEIKKMSLPQ